MSWRRFLDNVRAGLEPLDAAALEGVLPDGLDTYLDKTKKRRKQLAKAEAEFRKEMTQIVSEAAAVKRDAKSAQWLLKRKVPPERAPQLSLQFDGPAKLTLDMPDNGRETGQ